MKHFKTLGALAILALCLTVFAGTAAAEKTSTFTAGKAGANITEVTLIHHVFTLTGSETICGTIGFAGITTSIDYTTQTVTPIYQSCTTSGFTSTVDTGGCKYDITAHGDVTLKECTKGGITITVSNAFATCDIHVPNQTIKAAITWTKDGASNITADIQGNGIAAEVKTSHSYCPVKEGKHTDATYTGRSTFGAEGTSISID